VINGEKWYVTSASHAGYFILQTKLEGGENEGAHCLFFIEMDSEGVELVRTPPFFHRYASHHLAYRFNDVRVPSTNRIGDEGGGMEYTYAWFRRERLMIAARCCGAASRLIDEATTFARERIINGKPITEYQATQFMLADSLTELWAARLMTYETADAHGRGEDVKVLHARCSMTKLYASEMANRIADRAVQIFGGRGYMRKNVAERFYRELLSRPHLGGHQKNPAHHHRPQPAQPRPEAARRLVGSLKISRRSNRAWLKTPLQSTTATSTVSWNGGLSGQVMLLDGGSGDPIIGAMFAPRGSNNRERAMALPIADHWFETKRPDDDVTLIWVAGASRSSTRPAIRRARSRYGKPRRPSCSRAIRFMTARSSTPSIIRFLRT